MNRLFLNAILLSGIVWLSGCDIDVTPVGGAEGRTLVYAVVGRQGVPNGGIVCTRIGTIVIDPPLSPAIGDVLNTQALAKSKIFWDGYHANRKSRPDTLAPPVLYVLNTTYRATHTFGNQSFDKADIISTSAAKEKLVKDGPSMREELRQLWKVPGLETHYTAAATLTVEGTLNLETPEAKVQFMSMGDCVGEGDAVVYLPFAHVLFAGDIVAPNVVPYYKGRTATFRNWIKALKKLEALDIDTVVPGHGELAHKDAITRQREFVEALVAATEAAVKKGLTAEQAAQAVKLDTFATWDHYGDWLGENVKLAYREIQGEPAGETAPVGAGVSPPKAVERADSFRDK